MPAVSVSLVLANRKFRTLASALTLARGAARRGARVGVPLSQPSRPRTSHDGQRALVDASPRKAHPPIDPDDIARIELGPDVVATNDFA